jgi:hypothetical protein
MVPIFRITQFEGVAAGTYIAYARDKMVAVYQILLSSMYWIDISPNGDG